MLTFVPRAADLHELFHLHLDLFRCWLGGGLLGLLGRSPGPVGGTEPALQPLCKQVGKASQAAGQVPGQGLPLGDRGAACLQRDGVGCTGLAGAGSDPTHLPRGEYSQVSLMFLPLRVGQVAALYGKRTAQVGPAGQYCMPGPGWQPCVPLSPGQQLCVALCPGWQPCTPASCARTSLLCSVRQSLHS